MIAPASRYNFCTLFDSNYAPRGLALYRSLMRHCRGEFRLTILCMDEKVHGALALLGLPNVRLWRVEDIGDKELLALRDVRPMREFCWTCPGPLMLALLSEQEAGSVVAYLDADLAFFSDIRPIYDELGDKDILIHGHNFAPNYAFYAETSGIFNVGLVAVRNSAEGIACLSRWRAQNIEMCVLDPEKGYCGDQKYLEEWPSLYPSLVILRHPGGGVAPWNVEMHRVTRQGSQVLIDGVPLIFYHYHALRVVLGQPWLRWAAIPAIGYKLDAAARRYIYRPYVRALREAQKQLTAAGLKSSHLTIPRRQFISLVQHSQLVIG
jgi:hypothetical protein